jgi:hypothetical protein
MNYEQTIVHIKENLSIPIHYIQLDSWWYYKGLADGVSEWTARPEIFPDGLNGLNRHILFTKCFDIHMAKVLNIGKWYVGVCVRRTLRKNITPFLSFYNSFTIESLL